VHRLPLDPAEVMFDGLKILTAPGLVMTPVPTTEALVQWAAEWIRGRSVRVADVGTGSGAVAIALALRAPAAGLWATDDSERAVALARANVARHGLERVRVLLGDLLEPVPGELDLVVANLPYPAEARARGAAESACSDQPAHAIYAPGDGLAYYRALLEACRSRLNGGGALAIQLYGSVLAAGRGRARRARPGDRDQGRRGLGVARGCRLRRAETQVERRPDEAGSGMSGARESKQLPAVVVGVDGSAGSREALQWAIGEARLREVPLRAIHAWTYAQPLIPSLIGYPYSAEYVDSTNDERQQTAERLLEHMTATLAETHEIEIQRVTAEGPAARVLIDAVGEDDLLVVGSRGHGGFSSLLLGSVSQQCAHHTPCPVVIVRGTAVAV
jgi:nucleotide-binding universal stress UspA family protein